MPNSSMTLWRIDGFAVEDDLHQPITVYAFTRSRREVPDHRQVLAECNPEMIWESIRSVGWVAYLPLCWLDGDFGFMTEIADDLVEIYELFSAIGSQARDRTDEAGPVILKFPTDRHGNRPA